MFFSESHISVRYAETDKMGIVHHSNYPIWFEVGRTEFIKSVGISYSKIEEKGLMLPLRSLKTEFLVPAKYEDNIIIKTFITEFTNTRLTLGYEVYKEDLDQIITTGETGHIWTTTELKPVNLKKREKEIYDMFLARSTVDIDPLLKSWE